MSRSKALHKLMFVAGVLFFLLVTLQAPAQVSAEAPTKAAAPLHHKLDVEIFPTLKMIKAQDTLTFPADTPRKISFLLHKDLQVAVISANDSLVVLHPATQAEPFTEYGLTLSSQDNSATLVYSGVIYDPVVDNDSRGLISLEGATLFGSTYWYPDVLGAQKSFELSIRTPADWKSLSQGQMISLENQGLTNITRYKEIYPQEDIYLIAGPFKSFETETASGKKLRVLLRKDEPALAQNFLAVMPDYIQHFSEIIAPYPYGSFSVVENLWETGYGMPSFTLLGSTVVRLPFILNSSLPHEILHNWWGNSVYVDYDKGNWSEGLTTYMADYWQQEKINADRAYRMKTLANYSDFVTTNPASDFPLRQFKGRHNSSSQAVGYGKSMMLFHMLEFRFGKELFQKALQDFYNVNIFKRATFRDIQTSFEKITNQNLESLFTQWLDRKGAPVIELTDVKVMRWLDGSNATTYVLSQKQEEVYNLSIPVIWTLESGEEVRQVAKLADKSQIFTLVSRSRPVKISVDPDFHLFRSLYTEERPATVSSVLGSPSVHFYFDGNNGGAQAFVQNWSKTLEGKTTLHNVSDAFEVPSEGAIVLVGDNAAFANFMKSQLADQKFQISDSSITIEDQAFALSEVSTVLVTRLKNKPTQAIVWVRWSADNNPGEWAKRLTHYGNMGILVFKGRPAVLQSSWPVTESPLQRKM
ncbi:M1 family metallopeptidase [Bdellovibrio svalbardensis]|uniref:M1 family peptidase n=1 Tax=Bdellovibrio svalbardensis TaxID=2972972 RepID=A0ABT6DKU5_9BACT|nr:M1 family aminopeptidase [Bdellovibrio svalbardensis]MDG0817495.1 M1 family peptidase [Bdellovibrio svalbardensis]